MAQLKLLACIALCMALSIPLLAQDKTYAPVPSPFVMTSQKVVVIPCRPDMMLCDLDRELENRENIPLAQIRETLRMSLSDAVAEQCMRFATGDVHLPEAANLKDYQDLFAGSRYEQIEVSSEQESNARIARIKAFLEEEKPEDGTRVEQGQLRTYFGKDEKYMNLLLASDSAVKTIHEATSFDYLVCINEIDIQVMRVHEQEMGQDWDRRVKVHYTIFDPEGKEVASGAAYSTYPGTQKGMKVLIQEQFPNVAAQIAADMAQLQTEVTSLPGAVPIPQPAQKRAMPWTKKTNDK